MPKRFLLFLIIFSYHQLMAQTADSANMLFDAGWQFFKGGVERGQEISVDDSHWCTVDLPHDWSIEDIGSTGSPFDSNAISQVGGGFTVGGTGWYRKTFTIPSADKNKRIHILFEGVYMNADVWLNGQHLGNHPYGYTSFWYDLTDKIKTGEKNILAVQVKNEGQNSRWYSGSGINRHVWLQTLEPVHLVPWGTQVISTDVSAARALIHTRTAVKNTTEQAVQIQLVSVLMDPGAKK